MRKGRERTSIFRSIWTLLKIVLVLFLCFLGTAAVYTFRSVASAVPDSKTIENYAPAEPTRILSYDNVLLATVSATENRQFVPISSIPQNLKNATIAIEDSNFYSHAGMSIRGTARAFWDDVTKHSFSQGGSTITQQLARNLENASGHSITGRQKSISRKVIEAILALELERHYAKDEILELYLNQVYYGSLAYGVQAAARAYFGKNVSDLDLADCALLAGLPQRPSDYDPYKNLDLALRRRSMVLTRMQQLGYITADEKQMADEEMPVLHRAPTMEHKWKAPYFVDYVMRQLNQQFGEDLIKRGGLTVYTTLNYRMQQVAEQACADKVQAAHAQGKNVHQMALVSIDQHTGYIKAMVGGVGNFQQNQYNRAIHARQPGSSFKLFDYTALMATGASPDDRISDALKTYPAGPGKWWTPRNYDNRYRGMVTFRNALAYSENTVAVKVAQRVGMRRIIALAEKMGVHSDPYCEHDRLTPYLPTAIGASEVAPLEMCVAYATSADRGVMHPATAILRIKDRNGATVYAAPAPNGETVVPPTVADKMNSMLRSVVEYGTGARVNVFPKVWGKTGTTQDDRDAWFIGFTPELTTAVWAGNDIYLNNMRNVQGGQLCGSAWVQFMKSAVPIMQSFHQNQSVADAAQTIAQDATAQADQQAESQRTVTVKICTDSQLLATKNCPHTAMRTYPAGSEPTTYCTLDHSSEMIKEWICPVSGKLATPYCPNPVLRSFPIDQAPVDYCTIHKPSY